MKEKLQYSASANDGKRKNIIWKNQDDTRSMKYSELASGLTHLPMLIGGNWIKFSGKDCRRQGT